METLVAWGFSVLWGLVALVLKGQCHGVVLGGEVEMVTGAALDVVVTGACTKAVVVAFGVTVTCELDLAKGVELVVTTLVSPLVETPELDRVVPGSAVVVLGSGLKHPMRTSFVCPPVDFMTTLNWSYTGPRPSKVRAPEKRPTARTPSNLCRVRLIVHHMVLW